MSRTSSAWVNQVRTRSRTSANQGPLSLPLMCNTGQVIRRGMIVEAPGQQSGRSVQRTSRCRVAFVRLLPVRVARPRFASPARSRGSGTPPVRSPAHVPASLPGAGRLPPGTPSSSARAPEGARSGSRSVRAPPRQRRAASQRRRYRSSRRRGPAQPQCIHESSAVGGIANDRPGALDPAHLA